ncbi:MAG: helix-turn-helix transcriptional regulator [Chloroflexota bacterium]
MPKLESIRRARLFTQQSLAEQASVAVSTIYLIEAGRTTPRFNIIRKLCKALMVEPEQVDEFRAAIERSGRAS